MKDLVLTPSGLRMADQLFPCVVGKNGITSLKREGDRKTPIGEHQIVGMLYRPDTHASAGAQARASASARVREQTRARARARKRARTRTRA